MNNYECEYFSNNTCSHRVDTLDFTGYTRVEAEQQCLNFEYIWSGQYYFPGSADGSEAGQTLDTSFTTHPECCECRRGGITPDL